MCVCVCLFFQGFETEVPQFELISAIASQKRPFNPEGLLYLVVFGASFKYNTISGPSGLVLVSVR